MNFSSGSNALPPLIALPLPVKITKFFIETSDNGFLVVLGLVVWELVVLVVRLVVVVLFRLTVENVVRLEVLLVVGNVVRLEVWL